MQHYINEVSIYWTIENDSINRPDTWPIKNNMDDRPWAIEIDDLWYNYVDVYKDDPEIIYAHQFETEFSYKFKMINRGM